MRRLLIRLGQSAHTAGLMLILVLAACSASPKADVAALKLALAAADTAALAYVTLPECGPAAPPLCAKIEVVERIRDASGTAYASVNAVDALVSSYDPKSSMVINAFSAAGAALTGYQAILASLPTARKG